MTLPIKSAQRKISKNVLNGIGKSLVYKEGEESQCKSMFSNLGEKALSQAVQGGVHWSGRTTLLDGLAPT